MICCNACILLQDRYMARDTAELKEVLQSVSDLLKPFYAQVSCWLCQAHQLILDKSLCT